MRKHEQRRVSITDVGTENMKILFSPGLILNAEYDFCKCNYYSTNVCGQGKC